MAIRVSKVWICVDGTFVIDDEKSKLTGIAVGALTSMRLNPHAADTPGVPAWNYRLDVLIEYEDKRQLIPVELELREEVANLEAITRRELTRQMIPDHVKLLVWARDGGSCIRCGSESDLQFDHIIPLSRGGGDQADNIQLLCRSCNLAKGPRLV